MNDYPAGGVLFTNNRKQKDSHPDYTGNIELEAQVVHDLYAQLQEGIKNPKLDIAGWRKQSSKGTTFISLRGNVIYERTERGKQGGAGQSGGSPRQERAAPQRDQRRSSNDIDDEIPFN